MPSHLNSYPKTFNRWGHLRALPLRKPVQFPFLLLGTVCIAAFFGYSTTRSLFFQFFNRADVLQKDVNCDLYAENAIAVEKESFRHADFGE